MFDNVKRAADYIKTITNATPKCGIILGSGLGALADEITNAIKINFKDIVGFKEPSVLGHTGELIFGKINNTDVLLMKGRYHFYEGYTMKEVTYPIYVMNMLGIKNLIVTNASGGINESFEKGSIMIIEDMINAMGTNPLIGKNDERLGERFPDMTEPFDKELIKIAKDTLNDLKIDYKQGVYLATTGPSYETKAEIKMFRAFGADCVGMSTVPETIVANYLGMKVLGISCITNMATGIQNKKHSHTDVVDVANSASANLCSLVKNIIHKI